MTIIITKDRGEGKPFHIYSILDLPVKIVAIWLPPSEGRKTPILRNDTQEAGSVVSFREAGGRGERVDVSAAKHLAHSQTQARSTEAQYAARALRFGPLIAVGNLISQGVLIKGPVAQLVRAGRS